MADLDLGAIAGDAAAAMLGVIKKNGADIKQYAAAEAQKIATSCAQIAQLRAQGIITDEEMRLHLDIQKNASRAVLMAVKGIAIITAEQAVNAAIGVVSAAVGKALGFALI